jgi:short-subunit dehydrogenase
VNVMETVLITGASSGIGRELAKCFAVNPCRLILVARKRNALESLAEELRKDHRTQSEVLPADLAQSDVAMRIFRHLETHGTKVDVLVNNAGFGANGSFAELPVDRQMEMLQVNISTLTHLSRLMLPGMIKRGRGGILNVASTAAFQGGPGMAVYYASKAYVLSFSEAIAEELDGTGVVVTVLCPGATATNFFEAANASMSNFFRRNAMSAESVARIGHDAFRDGKFVVVAGTKNKLMSFAVRLVPRAVARKVAKYLNHAGVAN